ncbi:hypothetical protein NQ317_010528 [Molorchus minor]|uniref:Uncharacterized protein n=1 Tax=Molorchus minor TaxID=1323400 RepID=A0ABQ9JYV9_9CUCU|nr:hypothetical protein NQ317_010528 [Molorchus minor]
MEFEEDMENYMYFKLMKNVPIKLKPGVIPHIFDCQKKRQTTHKTSPQKAFFRRQRRRELTVRNNVKLRIRQVPKRLFLEGNDVVRGTFDNLRKENLPNCNNLKDYIEQ